MIQRRTLQPPDLNPDGISATDWVRTIGGRKIGQVESVTDDNALVDWLDGSKQIISCVHLRRVPPDRGSNLDRRRP